MQPRWHKLPPVPGWYAVAQMHRGKVEGFGCAFYSEWIINALYEPLPVEEVDDETE